MGRSGLGLTRAGGHQEVEQGLDKHHQHGGDSFRQALEGLDDGVDDGVHNLAVSQD